jgi:endonuclease/exonuclease/phosphatase family metal-dependent hydrolase
LETKLDIMLFNYENGGRQPDGTYCWEPLGATVAATKPHLFVMNEAKLYANRGNEALYAAADALRRSTGTVYVPLLCTSEHGPYPPAVFYRPDVLGVVQHYDAHPDNPRHQRNLIVLRHYATGRILRLLPIHFSFLGGRARLSEAELITWAADPAFATIIAGDFNSISSRPNEASRRFEDAPAHKRHHKGRWIRPADRTPGQLIKPDTDALDVLYDSGMHDVADIAHEQGLAVDLAYRPTVNHEDSRNGALRIDRVLVSQPLCDAVDGMTYRVHIPQGPPPSDHRAVSVSIDLSRIPQPA